MLFMTRDGDDAPEQQRAVGPDEDTRLARAAADGDTHAFEQLIRKYERLVYRTAFYTAGNAADAEDLTQEILLKLWHGLSEFRGEARFLTWLLRIARNTCADHLRKKQRSVQTEPLSYPSETEENSAPQEPVDTAPERDPHTAAAGRENAQILRRAMAQLSEEHRMLIILRDVEGTSYERMAAVLGLEIGTVKSRLFRARAQLKEYLSALGIFD